MSAAEGYDLVVIGAGPAGAAAAIEAASRGASVLLVERHALPRGKVCGGCLGTRALACLERLGVDPAGLPGARRLDRARVRIAGASTVLPVTAGVAVDRAVLDHALVRRAAAAGASILERTRAVVGPARAGHRLVRLGSDAAAQQVRAGVVLDATGLPTTNTGAVADDARVGLGQARPAAGGPPPGEVWMLSTEGGYVGMVRFGDGTLNVAASVRAGLLASGQGAGMLVDAILTEAGVAPLGWADGWRGTRPLRRVALGPPAERLLPVGDAAGFWEPFTGEGIGWALESGIEAVQPALRLAEDWSDGAAAVWATARRRWMFGVQARSRAVGWLSSRPVAARIAIGALGMAGPLSRWAVPAGVPRFRSTAEEAR